MEEVSLEKECEGTIGHEKILLLSFKRKAAALNRKTNKPQRREGRREQPLLFSMEGSAAPSDGFCHVPLQQFKSKSLSSLHCNSQNCSQAARNFFCRRFGSLCLRSVLNLFRVCGFEFRISGSAGLRPSRPCPPKLQSEGGSAVNWMPRFGCGSTAPSL